MPVCVCALLLRCSGVKNVDISAFPDELNLFVVNIRALASAHTHMRFICITWLHEQATFAWFDHLHFAISLDHSQI